METEMDMLSELPDSLLLIILSLLPFKEAARTSTLSKRWSTIWESTRNLHFNELDFVNASEFDNPTKHQEQRTNFLCFITNWISHYKDRNLDKFSLKISHPLNCINAVQNCIKFALSKLEIKELGIDFSDPNWDENSNDLDNDDQNYFLFNLPEKFSHVYQTLESLKLYSCRYSNMSKLVNFRSLKEVSFGWIEIRTSIIRTLLSTCKWIENLRLKCCWDMVDFDMGDGRIGLKRLVIEKCMFEFEYIRLNAPCLEYLKYCGRMVEYSGIDVRAHVMEEADVDFALMSTFCQCGNETYKLLQDLYPVRVLTVCSVLLQVIPSGHEAMRIERGLNVRHLTMKTEMHAHELCGFMFLLNSCPNLHKLTLHIAPQNILPGYYSPANGVDLNKFWERAEVAPCVAKSLKVVEVKGLRGTNNDNNNEIMACCYFIKYGCVLENINIYVFKQEHESEENNLQKLQFLRYLLTLPKASRNLKINMHFIIN